MFGLRKQMQISDEAIEKLQQTLIATLKENGIKSNNILDTFYTIKRFDFIKDYIKTEADLQTAYFSPFYIGYGQTISQPLICAIMIEALKITKTDTVLEIGTGSGYLTAILANLVKEVYTVEINTHLLSVAQKRLEQLKLGNINYFLGNGLIGLPNIMFNKIIVSFAIDSIPQTLIESLQDSSGIIVAPINDKNSREANQRLVKFERDNGKDREEFICYCKFVQSQSKIQN